MFCILAVFLHFNSISNVFKDFHGFLHLFCETRNNSTLSQLFSKFMISGFQVKTIVRGIFPVNYNVFERECTVAPA